MTQHSAWQATRLRDLIALGKPRLSMLVIFTSAIGVWLAPVQPEWWVTLVFVIATATLVAAANTLNCWLERELDALMHRTRERPLPAGRMVPRVALVSGLFLATASLTALYQTTNTLTVALGAIALVSYVLIYTPLKRLTPWSVAVGAVPGALPPLMGWTAATGTLGAPGWFLFGILFFWQLPHFMAISLYLQEDFKRAGFRVAPLVWGDRVTRVHLFVYTLALVALTLAGPQFHVGGWIYLATAALLGVGFIGIAAGGLRKSADHAWARKLFGYTLLYLPVLIAVLVIDAR